jgi:hypothetical protein
MRENAATKGRRYVCEARLVVRQVDGRTVQAECRGDGMTYALGFTTERGWYCQCPALGRCAHLIALGLVVDVCAPRRGQA